MSINNVHIQVNTEVFRKSYLLRFSTFPLLILLNIMVYCVVLTQCLVSQCAHIGVNVLVAWLVHALVQCAIVGENVQVTQNNKQTLSGMVIKLSKGNQVTS